MQIRSLETGSKFVTMLGQLLQAVGDRTSDPIDTAGWGDILVLVPVGTNDAGGSVTAKVTECATRDGVFSDLVGAAFPAVCAETTGPQADAGDGDDKAYGILLREGSHRRFIKGVLRVAGADSLGGVGMVAFFLGPASSESAPGLLDSRSSGEGIVAAV
jgi:hypothetical protein